MMRRRRMRRRGMTVPTTKKLTKRKHIRQLLMTATGLAHTYGARQQGNYIPPSGYAFKKTQDKLLYT